MRLNIRSKLMGGFGLILLLTMGVSFYSLKHINDMADLTADIYNHPLQITRAVLLADQGVTEMDRGLLELTRTKSVTTREISLASLNAHETQVNEQLAVAEQWVFDDGGRSLLTDVLQTFRDWQPIRDEIIALVQNGQATLGELTAKGKSANHVNALQTKIEALKNHAASQATDMYELAQDTKANVRKVTFIVLLVALLSGGLIGFLLSRNISNNIGAVAEAARRMAEGDLTQEVTVRSGDQVGKLAVALNTVIRTWREIIGGLRDNALRLSATAAELASSSEELSRVTSAQSDEISRTSSAMEEMSASVREVARSADLAAQAAAASNDRAQTGGKLAIDTTNSLWRADEIMQRLQARSDEIGAIVNLIQEIAAQTNILALNAAIEAAGAGAAGARFDVVAEEIRKLAGRTSQATGEIAHLIGAVQTDTQATAKAISSGATTAQESGTWLAGIAKAYLSVNDMVQNISSSTEEQSRASDEIAHSLEAMVDSSRQTASATQETASIGAELSNLAEGLRQAADQFKV